MSTRDHVLELVKATLISILGSRVVSSNGLRRHRLDQVTILNLHKVGPNDGSAYPRLEPNLFRSLLEFVVTNFEVLTFAQLRTVEAVNHAKPIAVLSFDDGYADFYEYAHPALEEYGVKANLNVLPGCSQQGMPPLNVALQDWLGKVDDVQARELAQSVLGREVGLHSLTKLQIAKRVTQSVKYRDYRSQQELHSLLEERYPGQLKAYASPMLTEEQIVELDSLYEIGLHSFSHASMGVESDKFFQEDLEASLAWFSQTLGRHPRIYAFPNGSSKQSQIEYLTDNGFEHVLLVGEDFSTRSGRIHNRFTLHAESPSEIRFRATGGWRTWTKGRRRL